MHPSMAKRSVFTAVFAALIALSTAYTTTTTTIVTTETNPRQQQQPCEQEIQQTRMTHCMEYVQSGMGRQYEPSFLRSAVANPQRYEEEEHLEECCEEMKKVSKDCRGDAVRKLIVQTKERFRSEEMEKQQMMRERVRGITQKCNLKSSPYILV